jgi:hypothetical protein
LSEPEIGRSGRKKDGDTTGEIGHRECKSLHGERSPSTVNDRRDASLEADLRRSGREECRDDAGQAGKPETELLHFATNSLDW